jgi:hypothetical protein
VHAAELVPAQGEATRIQQEAFSSFVQSVPVKADLDAAVLVGPDFLALGPVTIAVCGPVVRGLGWVCGERKILLAGWTSKSVWQT